MREIISFPCAGDTLVGTLDHAEGHTGLLIVSGGNEIRAGAHRGMAQLAAKVAAQGYPVFRFDRRGIGDSTGDNQGFESSAADIAAAASAFRAQGVARIIGFGNCDAASALAFFHQEAGIDGLILANPWTIEAPDDLPPPAAIRSHYAERLRDPQQWLRLIRGGIDISKLIKGLLKLRQKQPQQPEGLAARLAAALSGDTPTTILLARGDNTAIAFADNFKQDGFAAARAKVRLDTLDTDSHSFARRADKDWLFDRVIDSLS